MFKICAMKSKRILLAGLMDLITLLINAQPGNGKACISEVGSEMENVIFLVARGDGESMVRFLYMIKQGRRSEGSILMNNQYQLHSAAGMATHFL